MDRPTLPVLPLCSAPQAFTTIKRLAMTVESPDALLEGAVAIASHARDVTDLNRVNRLIQRYADRIRERVAGNQLQARLAHLHEFLFVERKFHGNSANYYSPLNSYLPAVIHNKCGSPIALCLIYKTVAERLGIPCWGIGLPGHFIVGVEIDDAPMLIDPFAEGRMLVEAEAEELMHSTCGKEVKWRDEMLKPVSNLHWLTRIIQNLLVGFGRAKNFSAIAAMIELEMLLWPNQVHLQRDYALLLARIGFPQQAREWLTSYFRINPGDPEKDDLLQMLELLKP